MSKKRNRVGLARAVWVQQERERAAKKPVVVEKPVPKRLTHGTPLIEPHVMPALGERYRDFTIVQVAVVSGLREWIVVHNPSGKQGRVVLDLITAQVLPYSDFGKWICTNTQRVADEILDALPKRTM